MHGGVDLEHQGLLCLAAELVGIERIGVVIVDVRRIQGRNEIGECVAVGRLVKRSERRISIDIELTSELRSGRRREACEGADEVLVAGFESVFDALVEFLIAAGCFDGPEIASANDGSVCGVEVEGDVDLVEGAQIEVLQCDVFSSAIGSDADRTCVNVPSSCQNTAVLPGIVGCVFR